MPWRLSLFLLILSSTLQAAPPGFENIFPAGGQIGTQVDVQVAGAGLDKPAAKAWISTPSILATASDQPKKFSLAISKDAVAGPYLMRLFTDAGVTAPRIFEVGNKAERIEKEPNDSLSDAKIAEAGMDITLNGVLGKSGDVDTHPIRVRKDKPIYATLHGYALGSPMDPALRLLNENGLEVAACHDTQNLDPIIQYHPKADGLFFLQVFAFAHPPAADVAFQGSANHVYRLTVTEEPPKRLAVSVPKELIIPALFNGCIAKPREEDIFHFSTKKGDDLQITIRAQAIDSPLDVTMRLEDADGNILKQADDTEKEKPDPDLHWKSPKDGTYKLVIADRFRHGSSDHLYELSIKAFTPSLTATLDTHAYQLEPGKTADLKINVKTSGPFTGKIQARAVQLPAGVTSAVIDVPAKGGEIKLTLSATPDAAPSQAPFAVEVTTSVPDAAKTTLAIYSIPFTEPRGDLLIMTDTQPWLTVMAKKK